MGLKKAISTTMVGLQLTSIAMVGIALGAFGALFAALLYFAIAIAMGFTSDECSLPDAVESIDCYAAAWPHFSGFALAAASFSIILLLISFIVGWLRNESLKRRTK